MYSYSIVRNLRIFLLRHDSLFRLQSHLFKLKNSNSFQHIKALSRTLWVQTKHSFCYQKLKGTCYLTYIHGAPYLWFLSSTKNGSNATFTKWKVKKSTPANFAAGKQLFKSLKMVESWSTEKIDFPNQVKFCRFVGLLKNFFYIHFMMFSLACGGVQLISYDCRGRHIVSWWCCYTVAVVDRWLYTVNTIHLFFWILF